MTLLLITSIVCGIFIYLNYKNNTPISFKGPNPLDFNSVQGSLMMNAETPIYTKEHNLKSPYINIIGLSLVAIPIVTAIIYGTMYDPLPEGVADPDNVYGSKNSFSLMVSFMVSWFFPFLVYPVISYLYFKNKPLSQLDTLKWNLIVSTSPSKLLSTFNKSIVDDKVKDELKEFYNEYKNLHSKKKREIKKDLLERVYFTMIQNPSIPNNDNISELYRDTVS